MEGRGFRRVRCSFGRLRLHGTAVPSLRFGQHQPQLVCGAGENAGREVVHWRFREIGRVAAWRRWTASPEHLTELASKEAVRVSLSPSPSLVTACVKATSRAHHQTTTAGL